MQYWISFLLIILFVYIVISVLLYFLQDIYCLNQKS